MAWIAEADHGYRGQPGSSYSKAFAGIKKAANGQWELHVRDVWGSNQGYLEEHGRTERKYRANTLDQLLTIGIDEVRQEDEDTFDRETKSKLIAAIREAIYEAQDLTAKKDALVDKGGNE